RIGATDDVARERALELPVDADGADDHPGALDRDARLQSLALVGGARRAGGQCEQRNDRQGRDREDAGLHSGLRDQPSERPEASSMSTTPAPANAAVTSR